MFLSENHLSIYENNTKILYLLSILLLLCCILSVNLNRFVFVYTLQIRLKIDDDKQYKIDTFTLRV